jgi:hypothetical protein
VRIELAPELRHGPSRQRWVGEDGMFHLETGQQKIVFDQLRMTATLSPGQILVLGPQDQPPRSLGRDFLADTSSGKSVQKLVLLRLVATPSDDSLMPGDDGT